MHRLGTALRPFAPLVALLAVAGLARGQEAVHVQGLVGVPVGEGAWPSPAAPAGNPFPMDGPGLERRDAKVRLGKALFWEEQVSSDNTMACGTCHDPGAGGADGRLPAPHPAGTFGSFGVLPQEVVEREDGDTIDYGFLSDPHGGAERGITPIIAPTMIGAYLFDRLFWDMRAGPGFGPEGGGASFAGFEDFAALEALAVEPPLSPVEMGHAGLSWADGHLHAKLGSALPLRLCDPDPTKMPADLLSLVSSGMDYDALFDATFATDPSPVLAAGSGVTRERFAAALAHYIRTLVPDQAPIDEQALTPSQQVGFACLVRGECFECHSSGSGVELQETTGGFADPFDATFTNGTLNAVRGRLVKVPTLRNVGLKRHFFTDGQVMSMDDLVDFYDTIFPNLLVEEGDFEAVVDFLSNALTDPRVAARTFPFDKPELASERPEHAFGANVSGEQVVGMSTPEILANVPALVPEFGRASTFKVGVAGCIPGAAAVLAVRFQDDPNTYYTGIELVSDGGFATTHIVIPPDRALVGVTAFAHWLVEDFDAPGGVATSRVGQWTLFRF